MNPTPAPKEKKVFYGWWIVAASTLGTAMGGWVYAYGISAFFLPLVNEFGWSRAALSGAISLARLEGGILGPLEGLLIDRIGPRTMMLIGVVILGIGYALLSGVNSLLMFYAVFVVFLATGSAFATGTTLYTVIANWFVRKRGLAMGIMNVGYGIGGTAVPILAWLISSYGWRISFLIAAGVVWGLGIPLAMMMRQRPEHYGWLPDGKPSDKEHIASEPKTHRAIGFARAVHRQELDFTPWEAVRTRAFWILSLVWGLRMFVTGALALHMIPLFVDLGFSSQLAATVLGLMTFMSIAGRLGFGWLGDILEKRYVLAICFAFMLVGLVILLNVDTFWKALVFVMTYGLAYGGTATPTHALRGEFFGRKFYGTIHGTFLLSQMWATIVGPVFTGYVFDVTGSYRLAVIAFVVLIAMAVGLSLSLRHPTPPARTTASAEAG
ncbi:MAG: MFS transporter [Chloroflexota bacterium]